MRFPATLLLLCSGAIAQPLFCQSTVVPLAVDAQQTRHLITPQSPHTTLRIFNLVPGKNYTLILPDDEHLHGCRPRANAIEMGVQKTPFDAETRSLQFVPLVSTVDFQLYYPCEWAANNSPTHFISVICETCIHKTLKEMQRDMVGLSVTHGVPVETLVRDVLIGGDCFDVTNITYTGRSSQIGTFANGQTNIGFGTGIIMATGDINVATGDNSVDNADAGYGDATPDDNLGTLTTGATYDMADLEFDFTPTQSPLSFDFVFASEEYCEYVNSPFNDVFGFFLTGPGITGNGNIALVPVTNEPVAINNVNHLTNSAYFINNTPVGATLCGQMPSISPVVNEIQFDGFTRPMTAKANVVPCQTYHIKLKVADVSDGIFDSAVFLKANSFDAGGNASVNFIVNNDPAENKVYEGCGTVQLLFDRVAANPNTNLTVQYTITGTATAGLDYVPIPTSIVIPSGQDKFTLPITILTDALAEGQETLIITLTSLCSCLKPQQILYIRDLPALQSIGDTVTICGPGVGTVAVVPTGGVAPLSYLWNTGATTSTISPTVAASTNYTVTVTDACGQSKAVSARIEVHPLPLAQLVPPAPQLCPGQEGQISVDFTGSGPFILQYAIDNALQPPIVGITSNPYTLIINQPGLYQVTSVTDGLGCIGSGQGALLVRPSTLHLAGSITPVKCAGQSTGVINTVVTGGQGPYTYAWAGPQTLPAIADPGNLKAGQYTATVTDGYGCTSTQTFTVTEPLPITLQVANVTGPNCYNTNGGSITLNVAGGTPMYTYQWTNASILQNPQNLGVGTYAVTVTDAAMCTTTAVATLVGNFTPPIANATAPVGLSCRNIPLPLDGTASSTGPGYAYQWTASPLGNITDGATTLIPTVNQGGTYTLVVTDLANGCTASDAVFITSTVAYPVANAGADQVLTCSITNLDLNGSGSAQGAAILYEWTASQGGTILSGANGLNPVIGTPGTYTLVVTDDANGCSSTDNIIVTSNIAPPTAIIGAPALLTCLNTSVTLNGGASLPAGGVSYHWMTTNGNIQSGQASANAVVTELGQYTLVATNTTNGCTNASTVTVNQDNSVPVANTVVTEHLDCITTQLTINGTGSSTGSNFSLQWSSSTGSGFISGQNTLMPIVNAPATYTLLITNLTSQCTASSTVVIGQNIQSPMANAGSPGTLTCVVDTLIIGDANALIAPNLSYQWTTTGGNILHGENTPAPTVNQPGIYQLIVTNASNGCQHTVMVSINQNTTTPIATVAPGGQISCTTPTMQLNGTGSSVGATFSYQWTSSTGGGIGAGSTTLMPTMTAAGTYTLVVTNAANGCTASASTTITTSANLPIAVATSSGILTCAMQQIELSAAGSSTGANFSYSWGTVNGLILGGQGTSVITVGLPAIYTLIVTNAANNCSATFAINAPVDLTPPVAEAGTSRILQCTMPTLQLDGTGSSTGTNFNYLWTGPGISAGQTTLTPTVNAPGTYQILVTNTQNGCTTTDVVQIDNDANAPIVQVAAPGILTCTNAQLTLNATGSSVGNNFSYQWNGPGLVTGSTSLMPHINAPGNYVLAITNSVNGCISVDTVVLLQQVASPAANAGPDKQLNCSQPQLQIGDTTNPTGSSYAFVWSGPGILSGGSTPSPVIDQGGLYSLTVTNTATGCTAVDQTNITTDFIYPQANAGTGFQLTCTETTYLLNATGSLGSNFTYAWTTTSGSFISPTNILNPTVNGAGQYYLNVTNTSNGCSATANVQITKATNVPNSFAATPGVLTCSVTSLTLSGSGSSSGSVYTYFWSPINGGNVVSGATSLTPVINQPGTYNLAVTDTTNLCVSNSSVVVSQDTAAPIIDAGQSPTLTCTNTSVNLQATVGSNGTFTYLWNAQNGGHIVSGSNTLTPVVNAVGNYLLTITSQQNGCTNTASVPVLADQIPPVSVIQLPDTLTCITHEIALNAAGSTTGNMQYIWTTSNGHFVAPPVGLQASADQLGAYSLLIKNLSNGCTSVASVQVVQNIVKPLANAGSNGLLTCAITSLELNGNGSSQNGNYFYDWTSPDGQILAGEHGLNPTIVAGGTYILVVVNGHNGCMASDETVIASDTMLPAVAIVSPGLITCTQLQVAINVSGSQSGANINYAWVTPNGHIVSGQDTRQVVVDAAGEYTLDVLNTTNGCSSTAHVQVNDNIVLPIADAGPPFTLTCSTDQVALQGSGSIGNAYQYAWSAQLGGSILSGANTLHPVVNQPGFYQLIVTNGNTGCKQTDQVQVYRETNAPTQFQMALLKPTCKNNDGVITFGDITGGVGPYLYSIDGGNQFFETLSFGSLTPGTYDLWIQDANGCEVNEPLVIPAAPVVSVSLIPEINLDLGQSVQLNAMLPLNYPFALVDTIIWQPLDGLTFSGTDLRSLLHPKAMPLITTEYTVTVISIDGCEASDRILLRVDKEPHIYIPNAFSPWDSDKHNDVVLIFADDDQIVQVKDFQIFDRWGEMVFYDQNFKPNDPAHGWNGYHHGKLMLPAVFVYYARILLIDGRELLYKGDITLVR